MPVDADDSDSCSIHRLTHRLDRKTCPRIAVSCGVCKAYGHEASCHWVTDEDAKEEMTRKYGIDFRFATRPAPANTTRKRTVEKADANKEAKKVKREVNLDSDED